MKLDLLELKHLNNFMFEKLDNHLEETEENLTNHQKWLIEFTTRHYKPTDTVFNIISNKLDIFACNPTAYNPVLITDILSKEIKSIVEQYNNHYGFIETFTNKQLLQVIRQVEYALRKIIMGVTDEK